MVVKALVNVVVQESRNVKETDANVLKQSYYVILDAIQACHVIISR